MIWSMEWEKIIVLHVQQAFWRNFFNVVCQITMWTTTQTCNSESSILCLYITIICAKQAEQHFSYFVQHDQHGIIAKHLAQYEVLL